MDTPVYVVEVSIKEVVIDKNGIGRTNPNRSLNYHLTVEKVGEVYNNLLNVADDFDMKTLGVKR